MCLSHEELDLLDSFDASSFGETRLTAVRLEDLVSPSGLPYFESSPYVGRDKYRIPLLRAETPEYEMAYLHPDRKVWIQGTPRVEHVEARNSFELYDRVSGDYLGIIPGPQVTGSVRHGLLADIHDGEDDGGYHIPDSEGYCQKCGCNLLRENAGERCLA